MVPVMQTQRRILRKADIKMLLFRIFVPNQNKMNRTRDNRVHITPTEDLPEGVGAEGSDYKEVSTKFPGSRLQSFWKEWANFNAHPRVVLVLKQDYCLPFKQKPPLSRFPLIKSSYVSPVKQQALLEAVQ